MPQSHQLAGSAYLRIITVSPKPAFSRLLPLRGAQPLQGPRAPAARAPAPARPGRRGRRAARRPAPRRCRPPPPRSTAAHSWWWKAPCSGSPRAAASRRRASQGGGGVAVARPAARGKRLSFRTPDAPRMPASGRGSHGDRGLGSLGGRMGGVARAWRCQNCFPRCAGVAAPHLPALPALPSTPRALLCPAALQAHPQSISRRPPTRSRHPLSIRAETRPSPSAARGQRAPWPPIDPRHHCTPPRAPPRRRCRLAARAGAPRPAGYPPRPRPAPSGTAQRARSCSSTRAQA
jgi:hypothetical protein